MGADQPGREASPLSMEAWHGRSDSEPTDRLRVFVSYSRVDTSFADELVAGLDVMGFTTSIDRHSIIEGEDWKRRLGGLIADSDSVVFVVSPDSAQSEMCRWEVEEAHRLSKRILPVLWRHAGASPVPDKLASLNYVRFDEGRSFMNGLKALARGLRTDLEWLREQTRLLARAMEWDAAGRSPSRLLSGEDVAKAKEWIASRPRNAPEPTVLHWEFISTSEAWENQKRDEALRQLSERERLVDEAELALREKEAAQGREAAQARRVVRRTMAGAAVSFCLAMTAGAFGWYAVLQQAETEQQARRAGVAAEQARIEEGRATAARNEALLTQSRYLADMSRQALDVERDPGTAVLLALEALPDSASDNEVKRVRPYWPPAEVSLEAALRQLREKAVLDFATAEMVSVAFSPDGATIVTGARTGLVRVWNAETLKLEAELGETLPGRRWTASVAVSRGASRIAVASSDGIVRIWSRHQGDQNKPAEWALAKSLDYPGVRSIALTDNADLLIAAGRSGSAWVWELPAGDLHGQHTDTGRRLDYLNVTSVAVTADGSRIFATTEEGIIAVWGRAVAENQKVPGTWQLVDAINPLRGEHLRKVVVSRDGRRIAGISQGKGFLWSRQDEPKGNNKSNWVRIADLEGHTKDLVDIAIDPEGERVLTASQDRSIRIWEPRQNRPRWISARQWVTTAQLTGHSDALNSIELSPDGKLVASTSADGTARIWDLGSEAGSSVLRGAHDAPVTGVAFIHKYGAITAGADMNVHMWLPGGQVPMFGFEGHTAAVSIVTATHDNQHILTGSLDGSVRIFETNTMEEVGRLEQHVSAVLGLAQTTDGRHILTGTNARLKVWDWNSRALIREVLTGAEQIAVSPDGGLFAVVSEGDVRLFTTAGWAQTATVPRSNARYQSIVFSSDGRYLFTSSLEGAVQQWTLPGLVETRSSVALGPRFRSIAVTPDGKRIIAGGEDGVVRLLDTGSLVETARWSGHTQAIWRVAVSPGGEHVLSGSADKTARYWNLLPTGQELVAYARKLAPRCMAEDQKQRFHLPARSPAWCEDKPAPPTDWKASAAAKLLPPPLPGR